MPASFTIFFVRLRLIKDISGLSGSSGCWLLLNKKPPELIS
jgi:hypothetical protein